jgi:hypothetical protein
MNDSQVAPPTALTSHPVSPSNPAVIPQSPQSPPAVQAPAPGTSKPVTETPVHSLVQEPMKAPAISETPRRNCSKECAKNTSLDQVAKTVTEEPVKGPPKEAPQKASKLESKLGGLQDSASFVLDILRTHRAEPIPKDTIQNVLKSLGYAMLDVDSILTKLKSAGEIIEPRDGFFRAV